MLSKFAQILLRIVLAATILDMTGGHWMVLQTVAWSQMIVDYSRHSPLKKAIKETFDSQHPCELCKSIQKGKQSEKKREAQQVVLKREFLCELHGLVISSPRYSRLLPMADGVPFSRNESPPVPPPRSLLG